MNLEELERLSSVGLTEINGEDIPAFGEIVPDTALLPEERVMQLLKTGKNPYFRKSGKGDGVVKISFSNNGIRLSESLASALANM